GLADDDVWSVCEGIEGSIWVGTGHGLSRIQDGEVTSYASEQDPHFAIKSVWPDRKGNVWLGAPGSGLFFFSDGQFTSPDFIDKLIWCRGLVGAVYEDRAGALWIGVGGMGVVRVKDNQSTHYGKQSGLPAAAVSAILEDHAGTLWLGTYGGGLCRLRNDKF